MIHTLKMVTLRHHQMNQLGILNTYRWAVWMLLILILLGFEVYPQTRKSLEEQRKQALLEIEETNRFLNETRQDQKQSLERLNLLNAQTLQFKRLISGIGDEISYVERQIGETSNRLRQMSHEIEKMKEEYAQLIQQAYKNRGRYNKLIYVLSAKDFNEAYRRMKYFQQYSEYRKKQLAEIAVKQKELGVVMEQLASKKTEKEKLLVEQQKENNRLEAVKVEQNKEIDKLKSQERKLRTQLIAQQSKAKRLQNEIEKMIAAEAKKRNTTVNNLYEKLTPDERLISSNFKGNRGRLPWPVEKGTITGFFGKNVPNPLFKDIRMDNNGIDITTVAGADVRVVFDGEVASVGFIPGYNMFVLVRHGNYITVYQYMVEVAVKQGEKVKAKQKIGKVYTEKGAKTAVLHFEIREERNPLDPELWIAQK